MNPAGKCVVPAGGSNNNEDRGLQVRIDVVQTG